MTAISLALLAHSSVVWWDQMVPADAGSCVVSSSSVPVCIARGLPARDSNASARSFACAHARRRRSLSSLKARGVPPFRPAHRVRGSLKGFGPPPRRGGGVQPPSSLQPAQDPPHPHLANFNSDPAQRNEACNGKTRRNKIEKR